MFPRSLKSSMVAALLASSTAHAKPYRIEIVDQENGWPVPLVELRTVHDATYFSDNAGLIAIDDPDLFGREIFFHLRSHGYQVKQDGFGYRGFRTRPTDGGTIKIEVERINVAKRLGRLTGAGLFAEQEKLGGGSPLPASDIFGCDSVLMTPHGGKLFWLWGDTMLPGYPLGIYSSTAALTDLHPIQNFKPPLALPFQHFRDKENKPRGVANLPGDGPTWLGGMISIPVKKDEPDWLVATYSKIKNHLDEYEVGLCVWDRETQSFRRHKVLWEEGKGEKGIIPRGHPFRWKDSDAKQWILYGDPFPTVKIPLADGGWDDPQSWEKIAAPTPPRSASDGSEVRPHRGAVVWNPYRKRWITVFTRNFGKPSTFGEIYYAEAESPLGPWGKAVKVVTHDNYTFYNPTIHEEITPEGASYIVFEGTYTAEFADRAVATPRYNYNQILYRLDLDDPKLAAARGE